MDIHRGIDKSLGEPVRVNDASRGNIDIISLDSGEFFEKSGIGIAIYHPAEFSSVFADQNISRPEDKIHPLERCLGYSRDNQWIIGIKSLPLSGIGIKLRAHHFFEREVGGIRIGFHDALPVPVRAADIILNSLKNHFLLSAAPPEGFGIIKLAELACESFAGHAIPQH